MTVKSNTESHDGAGPSSAVGRPRPKWVIASITIGLLVAAGGTIYAATGNFGNDDGGAPPNGKGSSSPSTPEHCRDTPKDTGVSGPESAPKDGVVEVAEDGVNLAKASDIADVTFGVILKNSSDLVARDVTVKMSLKRKDGRTLRNADGEPVTRKSTIPHVMPDKVFGTGGDVRVLIGEVEDVPAVKTEITVGEWWQPKNDVHEFASISATVRNKQDDPDDHINVTVDSQYCAEVGAAKAGVIFRDDTGKIIYGASGFRASSDTADLISGYAPLENYKPGKSKNLAMPNFWSISTQGAPGAGFEEQPDWGQTEVFPYADSDKGK